VTPELLQVAKAICLKKVRDQDDIISAGSEEVHKPVVYEDEWLDIRDFKIKEKNKKRSKLHKKKVN
jgi:hypothetical protein